MDVMAYMCFSFIIAGMIALCVHEIGHVVVARLLGYKIKFVFSYGYLLNCIPIPRLVYEVDNVSSVTHKMMIGLSGFVFEFVFSVFTIFTSLFWYYVVFAVLHIFLYQFYADNEHNDFNCIL